MNITLNSLKSALRWLSMGLVLTAVLIGAQCKVVRDDDSFTEEDGVRAALIFGALRGCTRLDDEQRTDAERDEAAALCALSTVALADDWWDDHWDRY